MKRLLLTSDTSRLGEYRCGEMFEPCGGAQFLERRASFCGSHSFERLCLHPRIAILRALNVRRAQSHPCGDEHWRIQT